TPGTRLSCKTMWRSFKAPLPRQTSSWRREASASRAASRQNHGAGRLNAPQTAMTGASPPSWLILRHTREERDPMSEQEQTMTVVDVPGMTPAAEPPAAPRQQPQAVADPRQIAAVVMA